MAKKQENIWTDLRNTIRGWDSNNKSNTNDYEYNSNKVLYRGNSREDYEDAVVRAKQNKALGNQWRRINSHINNETNLNNLTNVQLMYRDADLMDMYPEIGAALDIYAEEVCTLNHKGSLLNVYSQSERIKNTLEDLFTNRLQIHSVLPMIVRATCKYGNNMQLLNLNSDEGVIGWRQLSIHEMQRNEEDVLMSYYSQMPKKENETTFVWRGVNDTNPFRFWQIAHFRIMIDSLYLPMGVSILHKARRAWRQLTLMEDMMLIYRLERSFERRVYKINVGGIDDEDVPAYIDEIANNFKRAPIIDPKTGQVDLRKNMLGVDQDIFVPVRSENATNPIDVLPGATNLDKIEDLSYIQRKIYTALRVPKSFISFDETAGDGKNLALMDVRFAKMVNRIQQAIILELNKIATIHLFLLGFKDDLNNFTLTMNNPSTQADMQRVEEIQKRVTLARDALSDPGNGIPLMSWKEVQREVFHKNDEEIIEMLNDIRLEKSVAGELDQTREIIKRSGIFDDVDKLYGEPNAQYSEAPQGMGADGAAPGGGGGGSLGDLGGEEMSDEDFTIDDEEGGEVTGEAQEMSVNDVDSQMESKIKIDKNVINEFRKVKIQRPTNIYMNKIREESKEIKHETKNNLFESIKQDTDSIKDICEKIDILTN